jgi:hypothetical protein
VAILKILKTKSTTFSDDLFLCQVEWIGQTLPQLPWKQKRGDLKYFWIAFIKLHEAL